MPIRTIYLETPKKKESTIMGKASSILAPFLLMACLEPQTTEQRPLNEPAKEPATERSASSNIDSTETISNNIDSTEAISNEQTEPNSDEEIASEVTTADQLQSDTAPAEAPQKAKKDEGVDIVALLADNGIILEQNEEGQPTIRLDIPLMIAGEDADDYRPAIKAHDIERGDPTVAELFDRTQACLEEEGLLDEEIEARLAFIKEQMNKFGLGPFTLKELEEQLAAGAFNSIGL